ncbi:MAG: hypothetical protein J1E62_00610 [Lachnospiraceae bacterium]|nr:hypothetical protein [Lachnospiraceae bacterium]
MKKGKRFIIILVIIFLIVIPCIFVYMQQPVSSKDVLKRVSHDNGATYKAKEMKVNNLQEKMGMQLFQVERNNDEMGSVAGYFLVNRMNSRGLMCFIEDEYGDCVCADYDGDGKYEFLYVGCLPLTNAPHSILYVYETKGNKIWMDGAYWIKDNSGHIIKFTLKGGKNNKIYLYGAENEDSDTEFSCRDGIWNFTGKLSSTLELENITDKLKENDVAYALKNLREF